MIWFNCHKMWCFEILFFWFLRRRDENEIAKLFLMSLWIMNWMKTSKFVLVLKSEDFIFKHEVSSESRNEIFLNSALNSAAKCEKTFCNWICVPDLNIIRTHDGNKSSSPTEVYFAENLRGEMLWTSFNMNIFLNWNFFALTCFHERHCESDYISDEVKVKASSVENSIELFFKPRR